LTIHTKFIFSLKEEQQSNKNLAKKEKN